MLKILATLQMLLKTLAAPNEVHYINSNQTLPPPLTPEEEKRVFSLLEQGDATAKSELITHNLRLVVYIAKKFESSGVAIEDIISIGTIGLIKAVNTFSPSKNIKLATYASRCIENEILMYLRKASNRRQEASIDEPLNIDGDGNELLLSDILGSDVNMVSQHLEQEAEHGILYGAVSRLNPRERQIMEMRFGLAGKKEKTQKEVADEIGISQSYISRLEKRIIKTLRRQLELEEIP
ncbi:MAG: RNA polymerase sporulation sigma factor SigE [Faecalibacterium sp.]